MILWYYHVPPLESIRFGERRCTNRAGKIDNVSGLDVTLLMTSRPVIAGNFSLNTSIPHRVREEGEQRHHVLPLMLELKGSYLGHYTPTSYEMVVGNRIWH